MNNKLNKIIKSFSYTFLANMLSMMISTILILVVPRFIGVESYGYWQLYLFYSSYIAYMSLGLTDGIYLRYGGYKYNELKKDAFVTQYWGLMIFNAITGILISTSYCLNSYNENKIFIIILTCISGLLVVPRSLLTFTLQATNRIKEYSCVIIIEKITYFIIVVSILMFGIKEFKYLIVADILGKICSSVYAILTCKELVWGNLLNINDSIKEIKLNFSVGIKLLVANLASMLIIGVVRFSIQKNWSIETFGQVSLTLSISNMLMIFINSLSIVLFPRLCNINKDFLYKLYGKIRVILMSILIGILITYYPIKFILSHILPQYESSMKYMALIFPMCIFESKMLLLINTYFKVLRKEKLMMIINIITVVIGIITSYFYSFKFNNLNLTILNIVFLLAFRCIIAEYKLSKIIKISILKDIVLEILVTVLFITISWNFEVLNSFAIFSFIYLIYIFIKRKELKEVYKDYKYNIMKDTSII